jgi:glutamate N-acetyltransferase/amino-acid N-acetyltransferase
MAVGSADLPVLHPIAGVRIGISSAGIKKVGRKDLVVFELDERATIAGTFTKNAFCAAPVHIAKNNLASTDFSSAATRYLIINTGNANAGTGESGMENCRAVCAALAKSVSVVTENILPFSTGVIGEPLPIEKIISAIPAAIDNLTENNWLDAASGIMTTDTRPKATSRQIQIDGETITITGISKGAGMIKPNMATMLAYVATDANIAAPILQILLTEAVNQSFNRITIDGDTSTNDSCILIATAAAKMSPISSLADPRIGVLRDLINEVMIELAQAIIRDGEGATKFVSVVVRGGRNEAECAQIGFTIGESPLVKTALFASDPNWGRILAAIGRAGLIDLDVNKITIAINEVLIVEHGSRATSYSEAQGQAAMAPENIVIAIDLGRGDAQATVWTTDLSHDYVTINAEYRT